MSSNVYIKSLQLENFRGFKEFSLDMHPRLNVFLGDNGAGKSSILAALSLLLGTITKKLGNNSVVKTTMNYDDVHNGASYSNVKAVLFSGEEIVLKVHATPSIVEGKRSTKCTLRTNETKDYIRSLEQIVFHQESSIGLPVFIRYEANREASAYLASNSKRATDFSVNTCYDDAITMNSAWGGFFDWFKEKEDLENETKIKNKNFDYVDRQLHVVREAMKSCLGFNSFTIDRVNKTFYLKKNKQVLSFNQLSDGEKGYLLLVADIARRLAIANTYSGNELNGKGVVLIDEIELHLHPKWQRQIIPQLLATFPNCQFIITTHSPQVIGEVKPESIWILEEGEHPYHPDRSFGMDSSELLEEIMGAKSSNESVTKKLSNIEVLIDSEKYEEARDKLTELAKETGKISSLIGLNSLLTMYGEEQANIGE